MFTNEKRNLVAPVAIIAAIVMVLAGCVAFMGMSEAKTFPEQGIDENLEPAGTIEMAPGFKYTYTIQFDETLNEGVEVDDVVNTLPEGTQTQITKQVSGEDWGTLVVTLASDCPSGQYDLVLKATHAASGQTAYQYIVFDVKTGVTVTPTEIQLGNVIQNDVFSQEFVVTAGYGNIQTLNVEASGFTITSGQPSADGSQASETFTVTGTPDTIGAKTVTISGTTTNAETFTKTYNFTVYSEFEGTFEGQTITAIDGNAASSTQQTVPEDLDVTWAITAGQVDGVTIDSTTGVITVDSDNYINQTVTATATDSITSQTKTIDVLVQNEALNPSFTINAGANFSDNTYYTYAGAANRADALTVAPTLVADSTFSGFADGQWQISGMDGVVSIGTSGAISVDATSASATDSTQITVSATTEFGKTVSATFNLVVEGVLSVSEGETVTLINVSPDNTKTVTFTADAQYATLSYEEENTGGMDLEATLNEEGKQVTFTSSTAAQTYTYTLTVSTMGGQTADIAYTVNTYADLSFDSVPSNGAVAIAM